MSKRKKFAIMVIVSFWSALIMAGILAKVNYFGTVSTFGYYKIPTLYFSRWWDILFLPVSLSIILSSFLFLVPYLKDRYSINQEDTRTGLLFGLGFGLIFGLGVGDLFPLSPELGRGLLVGLISGIIIGLGIGLIVEKMVGHLSGVVVGLLVGLGFGFGFGLGFGLIVGLIFGVIIGLGIGLLSGIGIGVGFGLVWLIKKIVNFHKKLLKNL